MAQVGGFCGYLTRRGRFAMQKVVGASPIIRSKHPAKAASLVIRFDNENYDFVPERAYGVRRRSSHPDDEEHEEAQRRLDELSGD